MGAISLLKYGSISELVLCVSMFVVLWRKGLLKDYRWLAAIVAVHALYEGIAVPILFFRRTLHLEVHHAYSFYFYSFWSDFVLEAVFTLLVIYAIYKVAMKPFPGLSRIGGLVFRWVMLASAIVAVSLVIVPHTGGMSGAFVALQVFAERTQQGISILTICLLLFVCFAIKPLGLTFRSRIFGVSLGLGVCATASLVEAAWYSTSTAHSLYSPVYVVGAAGYLATLLVWGAYFAMPEPERKMVLLPTTSPFFLWNRVSEALGDAPGFVAISGFTPDMLAPAELKVLTAASKIARENRQRREEAELEQAALQEAQPFHSIAMQG